MSYLLDTNIVSLDIKNDFKIQRKLEILKFQDVGIYISSFKSSTSNIKTF